MRQDMTGSSGALDELAQRGYRFALSLTHNSARAEDLLQDAWHGVLRRRGPLMRPYLFAAIRNRFVDACRRERAATFVPLMEFAADEGLQATKFEEPDFELRNGALDSALSRLRPEERAALYLSAVEEMSAQDIGELLEVSRGTVLSLLHRGREKLRRMLQAPAEMTT